MKVVLLTSELLFDIATISHLEVAQIEDLDLAYRSEAGKDKEEEVTRCITSAVVSLVALCNRFRLAVTTEEVDNTLNLPERFILNLDITDRRARGKEQAIADCMHNIIVDNSLVKFYLNVQQPDLSKMHSASLAESIEMLRLLLFSKNPPLI